MKIEVKLSEDIQTPHAVIYTNKITDGIKTIVSLFENSSNVITANDDEKIVVLQPEDIYMVRTENNLLCIYCQKNKYTTKKRLYELGAVLGKNFMQISKSAYINLKQIDCVEPYFSGTMSIKLKNGCSEYISRKYLSDFKKYLGI